MPLTVSSGLLSLAGGYDFTLHDGVAGLKVDLDSLAVTDLALRPNNGQADYVVLPRIEIDGTHIDLAQRSVLVDAVKVSGGQIHGWLNENGSLNLAELGGARGTATTMTPAPATATPAGTAPTWVVKVPKIDLHGLSVDFQDRSLNPAPTLHAVAARYQRGTVPMAFRAAACGPGEIGPG